MILQNDFHGTLLHVRCFTHLYHRLINSLFGYMNSEEKYCCLAGVDKGGRSLLHNAVLNEHVDVVSFLVENYPQLINVTDNVRMTFCFAVFTCLLSGILVEPNCSAFMCVSERKTPHMAHPAG